MGLGVGEGACFALARLSLSKQIPLFFPVVFSWLAYPKSRVEEEEALVAGNPQGQREREAAHGAVSSVFLAAAAVGGWAGW